MFGLLFYGTIINTADYTKHPLIHTQNIYKDVTDLNFPDTKSVIFLYKDESGSIKLKEIATTYAKEFNLTIVEDDTQYIIEDIYSNDWGWHKNIEVHLLSQEKE